MSKIKMSTIDRTIDKICPTIFHATSTFFLETYLRESITIVLIDKITGFLERTNRLIPYTQCYEETINQPQC